MRLLLVWAALAAHCWAFSLNIFSFGSEKPYLHPLSPPETDPTHARVKRQAYQVYVDGDSSVSVDKSGQAESGNWGPWTPEGQCSRTCGGGVQVERRQCGGDCTGASVRYVSCNIDACAAGGDFRAEQCAAHNDDALDGNYHKWLPYKGKNKCELLCKPETGNFYYKWDEKVVDGTPCDNKGEDICVDGVCLALGCDGKLGSAKKVDKCGKCDGDGSTCKTIEGFFDERNLSPGYHDVIKLPAGATAIKIAEARPSSNNLALKNSSDHYYLNGNSMLQVESDVEAAGTVFEYDDDKPERISAKGPLTEDITVSILFRKGNKDAAIRYEFSIPLEEDVDYMYKVGDWSACSVTCGKGVMTRTPFCIDTKTQSRVEDSICDDNNATKPEFEKPCETVDCAAEWYTGDWEDCSETCGNKGEQYRVVYCHQVFANGRRITVEDGNCTESRPAVRQQCNRFACPEWQAGPWSACSEKCGDAFQYRSVTCRSEKEGDEGKLLPADSCDASVTLETQRTCNLGPCEGLTFLTTEWKLCSKCNDTEETREVSCKDNMGRAYPLEKCLIGDVSEIPTDTRTCATQQPCIYEWTASQWSKCSTECGHGHKTRRVVCAIHQLGDLEVVDEYHCQGDKPEERSNCTNEEKCTGTWYTGPWEQCSEECGGGKQTRMTVCLNYDKKPVPEWCDEAVKPTEEQECNVDECPTCFDSEFGCCPDNSTFATGDFLQGCSNCSLSTFGCCADNITEATGANSLGCPEFVESPLNLEAAAEGSGDISDEIAAAPQECKVTSEGGEEASVDCALALNGTTVEDGDLFGNGTDNNGTIHCSKTEFGCCPDWFTPASGKNNEGCAEFVQGACNGTQFGCCVDEVTLARGPNFEGCGEPSCAASLYGCCKDRTTIAFGPHYAGCERSSFPCELSAHGCCPDGETAALGKNGTGCGENCLTTKFGCCPDGMTVAKGDHNEGCGCEFAQFGCCPDGKTAAQGAGYFGCPESCAQSQYGCCPDGKTTARGLRKEGCPCQYTRYGCCPDGETTAHGPKMEGCDDCRYAKYGCCADGVTKARGPNDAGCPATTTPPFIMDGTVSPFKISQCALPQDSGNVCGSGYKLMWFYDSTEGRCQQFWYGGCGGNENKYQTKDMCESICVEPPAKGRCYLPKVEGPLRCDQPQAKYYYDHTTRQCAAFWWRGCLGNANNFNSWEECSTFCKDVGPIEQPTEAPRIEERPHAPPQVEDSPIYEPIFVEPVTQAPRPEEQPQQIQEPARERPPMPSIEEICRTTADAGPCESKIDQFFFNAYSGSCEQFTYGGCGGNLNRFRSVEECQQRCGFLARRQPEVVQPQQHQQPEQPQQPAQPQPQHYEQQQQQQQPQPHTFPVQPQQPMPQQPQTIIPSGKSREACHMKVDTGRCKGTFDSWYFEVATGSCVQFKYTGCGGNSNRFHSKEECEGLCVARSTGGEDGPAGANSVCDEAKETGTCTQFVTKWYYNKADGTCNRFHYGSCGGTGNRFESEQACKAACSNHQDVCTLPKVQGPCSGKHTYYFYNSVTQNCETFVYGGCLGNTNRFGTIEECQARCGRTTAPETELKLREPSALSLPMIPVETSVATVDPCTLPKATGKCTDAVTMYYYDSAAEMCLQFYFGGCDGNENRFATLDECVNRCRPSRQPITFPQLIVEPESTHLTPKVEEIAEEKEVEVTKVEPTSGDDALHARRPEWDSYMNVPFIDLRSNSKETETERSLQRIDREEEEFMNKLHPPPTSPLPELCLLPEERGPCFGNLLRYKYNQETKSCESFMYGGCEGNANHFTSEEACERNCGIFRDTAVCSMQQSLGECEHSVSKWYFNAKKGACELMMWTGCGGNGNRFSSREECESLCSEEYAWNAQDICELPRSAGPCSDAVSMWYYDSPVGECKQFTYGGCRGNPNRFVSKEACESRCAEKSQNLVHINAGAVCQLPFETGSCNEMTQKWFFDFATGQCHHFSYGGCGGNENRFNTRAECLGACATVGDRVMEPTKARIFANGEGPFEEGSEITLTCEADGQKPIVWYKDGNILYFDIRVEEFDEFERVLIRDASAVDSGAYSCAVGPDGLFSETFHVKVNAVKVTEPTCVDVGNHGTCSLIVKAGLCGNKRYGIFCCGSCTQHGLRV